MITPCFKNNSFDMNLLKTVMVREIFQLDYLLYREEKQM
jgi:hypothetical protein